MKISKLFHWLYALVMLLPIFAIGTSCLISTFNMASKEETEITYKYETNEVNNITDLQINKLYHYDTLSLSDFYSDDEEYYYDLYIYFAHFNTPTLYIDGPYLDEILNEGILEDERNTMSMYLVKPEGVDYLLCSLTYFYNNDIYVAIGDLYSDQMTFNDVDFFIKDIDSLNTFKEEYIEYNDNILPTASTYNEILSVETHNVSAQDVFYNSVDKVVQSPLFNWAYDSFLVAPFSFIVNLFSMPTNSVIVELLSYWLAISIIWLVFDLIMYIPLLVHRWLDKGVLE